MAAQTTSKVEPPRSEHPNEMSAGEKKDVVADRPDTLDHPVGTLSDLCWRFSSRTSIAEKLPVRMLRQYLSIAQSFVVTVVPLYEVGIHLGHRAKTRQFAGSHGSLQWAGKHFDKIQPLKPFPKHAGVQFAIGCKRYIGKVGMLARMRPRGVAVSRYIQNRKFVIHKTHSPLLQALAMLVVRTRRLSRV
jgi:hypothetical protein